MRRAADLALEYLNGLDDRHVGAQTDAASLAALLGGALPDDGADPVAVVEEMARVLDPGIVASAGPRYFGFVVGGALPAAAAADWLTGAWSQNAVLHALSPAAAAVELVAGRWMLDLLGLPSTAGVGFPTGAGLGNAVGLASARHAVLARTGHLGAVTRAAEFAGLVTSFAQQVADDEERASQHPSQRRHVG